MTVTDPPVKLLRRLIPQLTIGAVRFDLSLMVLLLVAFITRVSRNLSDRDAALAASRQRAAEEDHIVRMALLASGAAHELGTPLSSMAVLVGDW